MPGKRQNSALCSLLVPVCFVLLALLLANFTAARSSALPSQRAPVYFPHTLHADVLDCLDCHHDYESGSRENVLDESLLGETDPDEVIELNLAKTMISAVPGRELQCTQCHAAMPGPSTQAQSAISAMDAFHAQCISCHEQESTAELTLPTTCGSCHIIQNTM